MIVVTLSHPNGQQQEVILAGVPRKGESIRLTNGLTDPALMVEHVLWMEGKLRGDEPQVVLIVRPHPGSPV